jgi:hypothetical protein
MSRVPSTLTLPDVQQSFRELAQQLDQLTTGNVDFAGRRIINAGAAQGGQDYVTKVQLDSALKALPASTSSGDPKGPTVIVGTHAARVAHVPSPEGLLFYETDRTVFYVVAGGAWLYATGIMRSAPGDIEFSDPAPAPVDPDDPIIPPTDDGSTNTDITKAQPAGVPSNPNLRWFRANMCGVRVPGLPAVSGGAADASLVLTWFYDRYTNSSDRASIRSAFLAKPYSHFKLSWPDSRSGAGTSVTDYVGYATELKSAGFYVGHFLSSKDYDTADPAVILAGLTTVLADLVSAGAIDWACVGWELSLWLTPTQVQTLINGVAALIPGVPLYVHFQSDYIAFQQPGGFTADFWNLNVGVLTGLLHQKNLSQDGSLYQARIDDGLSRFAGNFLFVTDSGFGHPFDYVTYEVTAADQFSGALTEAQGDAMGKVGILAIAQSGPGGTVAVSGFGNGCTEPI